MLESKALYFGTGSNSSIPQPIIIVELVIVIFRDGKVDNLYGGRGGYRKYINRCLEQELLNCPFIFNIYVARKGVKQKIQIEYFRSLSRNFIWRNRHEIF